MNQESKKLIKKFFNNDCSEDDIKRISELLEHPEFEITFEKCAKLYWQNENMNTDSLHFDQIFEKVMEQIKNKGK